MSQLLASIYKANPQPFKAADVPVDKRISTSVVGGRLQDAGLYHNAYLSTYKGKKIPPGRLQLLGERATAEANLSSLEREVRAYNTAIIHLTNHNSGRYGRPALVSVASLTGSAAILELFRGDRVAGNPVDELRETCPILYQIFTDPQINRMTTSYEVLQPFMLNHVGPKTSRDLVDLVLVGYLTRRRHFADMNKARMFSEALGLQTLVWSMLGCQDGPMPSREEWERDPVSKELLWDPARNQLHHFDPKVPLTPRQLLWQYQVG